MLLLRQHIALEPSSLNRLLTLYRAYSRNLHQLLYPSRYKPSEPMLIAQLTVQNTCRCCCVEVRSRWLLLKAGKVCLCVFNHYKITSTFYPYSPTCHSGIIYCDSKSWLCLRGSSHRMGFSNKPRETQQANPETKTGLATFMGQITSGEKTAVAKPRYERSWWQRIVVSMGTVVR